MAIYKVKKVKRQKQRSVVALNMILNCRSFTVPNKRRVASRRACRGVQNDD